MDELSVIGVENGALVVVSADGVRFRVPITEALHTALRQNRPASPAAHRVGPREVQAMIRSGMTAAEVAERTGEPIEYIRRFEGPVLAEREYVITAARSVAVATAAEHDGIALFGAAIDARLDELGARETQWSSRKKDTHWIIAVDFIDGTVERRATWAYDAKKLTLAPADHEAQALSQQSASPGVLTPRLRAVATDEEPAGRFDSAAFTPTTAPPRGTESMQRPVARIAETDTADTSDVGPTADLLDALRRRRGEREAAANEDWESSRAAHPSTGTIRIVDVPLDVTDDELSTTDLDAEGDPDPPAASGKPAARRGRAAMPSWDEIVFGARPDDDPA